MISIDYRCRLCGRVVARTSRDAAEHVRTAHAQVVDRHGNGGWTPMESLKRAMKEAFGR